MSIMQNNKLKLMGKSSRINVPKFITKARFMKLLTEAPHARWTKTSDFEAFHQNVFSAGTIRTFGVRTGEGKSERFYEVLTESSINFTELRKLCLNAKWSNSKAA